MEASDVPHDLSAMGDWLGTLFAFFSPFGTDSRLHWTGLLAFLILGLAGFASQKRAGGPAADGAGADGATPGGPGALRGGGPLAFLFPPALYRTQSSLVDLKVYLAGRLVRPLIGAITCVAQSLVMAALAGLVAGGAARSQAGEPGIAAILAASLLSAILSDFSYYLVHRLSHAGVRRSPSASLIAQAIASRRSIAASRRPLSSPSRSAGETLRERGTSLAEERA